MTIIERIVAELDSRGMKKKTAIDAMGVTPSTFSTWIGANVTSIPSEYVPILANLFGVSCDELLTGEPGRTLTGDEKRLISLYRSIPWEGRQIVLAEAVKEKRMADSERT